MILSNQISNSAFKDKNFVYLIYLYNMDLLNMTNEAKIHECHMEV